MVFPSHGLPTALLLFFFLLLIGGCRSSPASDATRALRSARDATVYVTVVTRALALVPRYARPSASLGARLSAHLSRGATPVHGALRSTAIIVPLTRTTQSVKEPFATIQTIGDLLQITIIDMLNRNPERGAVLNRYLTLLRSTLEHAQGVREHLDSRRRELTTQEREQRSALRTMQKDIDAAERSGDFHAVGLHQRALSEASGEHGKTKASMDELKNTLAILDNLTDLAEERLQATEQNREALIVGIRVMETPGVEELGILERMGGLPRRSRRKARKGGLLDFSDL